MLKDLTYDEIIHKIHSAFDTNPEKQIACHNILNKYNEGIQVNKKSIIVTIGECKFKTIVEIIKVLEIEF